MKLFVAVLLLALAGESGAWTFSEGRHPKSHEPMREYALYLANTDRNSYYDAVIRLRAVGAQDNPTWEVFINLRWYGERMCNRMRERCWIEFVSDDGRSLVVDVRPGHRHTVIDDSRTVASIINHLATSAAVNMSFRARGGFAYYQGTVRNSLQRSALYLD